MCRILLTDSPRADKIRQTWGEPRPATFLPLPAQQVLALDTPDQPGNVVVARATPIFSRSRQRPRPPLSAASIMRCPRCPGNVRFKVHRDMRVQDMMKLIDGPLPAEKWPPGWHNWPVTLEAHRLLWDQRCARPAAPPQALIGRGIVTQGGGAVYFGAAYVMVSVLRRTGCQLPVEWWHLGPAEMDEAMRQAALSLGNVRVVDAHAVAANLPDKARPRSLGGWESKVFAIRHSAFAEVLFLDADQVPACDPTYLFDDPRYRQAGAVLWPDIPNDLGLDVTEQAFQVAGLKVPGKTRKPDHHSPSDYRPVESGQLLLDRTRCWHALDSAAFVCDHCDYFWGGRGRDRWLVYGDKSAFFLGFEKARFPYLMPRDTIWTGDSKSGAFLQFDLSGKLVFQHRCQPTSKWSLHGSNPVTPRLHHFRWCLDALDSLRSLWDGQVYSHARGDQQAQQTITGRSFVLGKGDHVATTLKLEANGTVSGANRPADHDHWSRHGDFLVLSGSKRAGNFFKPAPDGTWHGEGSAWLAVAPPGGWILRDQRDTAIFHDVTAANEYGLPEAFADGTVVVDVGAHIGSFALACLRRGAAKVLCVEPRLANLDVLIKNLAPFRDRVEIYPVAAWHNAWPPALLPLAEPEGAQHSGGGSVTQGGVAGEYVPAFPLEAILARAASLAPDGRVRLLKLDCEGSEFPCLFGCRSLNLVDELVGEYHLAHIHRFAAAALVPGATYTLEGMQQRLAIDGFDGWWHDVNQHDGSLGHFRATRSKP